MRPGIYSFRRGRCIDLEEAEAAALLSAALPLLLLLLATTTALAIAIALLGTTGHVILKAMKIFR
jgi:hypothetical protein